jgi:hypothetical protein
MCISFCTLSGQKEMLICPYLLKNRTLFIQKIDFLERMIHLLLFSIFDRPIGNFCERFLIPLFEANSIQHLSILPFN